MRHHRRVHPLPPRACPPEASEWTATGHEPPVFLDERGLRRRWVVATGALAAGGAGLWLGALVAGAVGFSTLPAWQPFHGAAPAGIQSVVALSDGRHPVDPAKGSFRTADIVRRRHGSRPTQPATRVASLGGRVATASLVARPRASGPLGASEFRVLETIDVY